MLFNSLFFLFVFFPIVAGLYYLIPHRYRWCWLLLASCYFYMSFIPGYLLILAFTISIDYVAGIYIEKLSGAKKRNFLLLSIVSNIGILFIFKYFNFFNANLSELASLFHWNYSLENLSIILPIGLSFHTFQSLSYIIEVYRGRQKAERNFGIFALYVMFFPQLVAGPIERPQHLLHQFTEKHSFRIGQFMSGMRLILWGLCKKVVIADRVSVFVNQIFNNAHDYAGPHFILATFLFAFQIYCDFSGYSDMARGLARTLGFELMINFNAPYFSKSVSEFWHRWHISLSTWFRDYVYIPLGGNRVPHTRWLGNILITFLLSGMWHGANWTFVVWGLLNGLYILTSVLTQEIRLKINRFTHYEGTAAQHVLSVAFTFLLIGASWIFFRARSLSDAWYIFGQILSNGGDFSRVQPFLHQHFAALTISFCAIGALMIADYGITHKTQFERLRQTPIAFQIMGYSCAILIIVALGKFTNEQFIYFQF
ncbi:MAG: MBOAT family O-acyltransferase [bacterium]|nr:MBOAT family O-acyltransferase [bacterium]